MMDSVNDNYRIDGNKVIIGNDEIIFDFPIEKFIEIDDMLIVLLDKPTGKIYNENVFGVSLSERKTKWQIAKRKKIYPGFSKDCPFTSIILYEDRLRLNNWCDIYLIVDPLTGKILEDEYFR